MVEKSDKQPDETVVVLNLENEQVMDTSFSDRALEVINNPEIPKKVTGLNHLAAHGLPVPAFRKFLSAKEIVEIENIEDHQALMDFLESLKQAPPNEEGQRIIIVRSAHPKESEFSGGVFESLQLTIDDQDDPAAIWQKILKAREEIIELAKPENSLQIRRDIKFRGINDFDPKAMGIFINGYFPSKFQMTVVPLNDGNLSLRYYSYSFDGPCARSVEISSGKLIGAYAEDNIKNIKALKKFHRHKPADTSKVEIKNIPHFLAEIERAQKVFDSPQEMEVHLDQEGDHIFVQSKNVLSEAAGPDVLDNDLFEGGVKGFFVCSFDSWEETGGFVVERVNQRDEVRRTKVIVIDEEKWAIESGLLDPRGLPGLIKGEHDLLTYKMKFQSFYSHHSKNEKGVQFLEEKYEEAIKFAEEIEDYTLLVRNLAASEWYKDDSYESVYKMRKMLMDSASVLIRPYEIDHVAAKHVKCGTIGPRQIGIYFMRGYLGQPDLVKVPNEGVRADLMSMKTGEPLLVMMRDNRASLLPDANFKNNC